MVNSKNNVSAILNALERGAFYSSCGPELHDFYVENGKAHVVCSPAAEIVLRHLCTPYLVQRVIPGQPGLTHAGFKALPHNSSAALAMPFLPSASCRNLDLPPVNLRFLQSHLTKNAFAIAPTHLCGIAQNSSLEKKINQNITPQTSMC